MAEEKEGKRLPTIRDYSIEASRKAVLARTLQHPLSLYPAAIGVLGALAALVLGPSLPVLAACAGGFTLGTGSWIINYFFRDERFAGSYIQELNEAMAQYQKNALDKVKKELAECKHIPGAQNYVRQGVEQFTMVQKKYHTFIDLLGTKLNTGELTYGRYAGTAEQVYLAVINNLEETAAKLKSISSIDEDYIESRKKEIEEASDMLEVDKKELATLTERQMLKEEQMKKVSILLTANEEAMTALDRTTAAIADITTTGRAARIDMETARKELEELAGRAHEYSS